MPHSITVRNWTARIGLLLFTLLAPGAWWAAKAQARVTGAGDEFWAGSLASGLNGAVRTLAEAPNGDLYVGGDFTDVNGDPAIDYLARWDGAAWQPVVTGLNGTVRALRVASNGDLYVGGEFTDAGGNPDADHIVRWRGNAMQALGTGLPFKVYAIAVQGASAYAAGAGALDTAHGYSLYTSRVMRWNGASWQQHGSRLIGSSVTSLEFTASGTLFAAGNFRAVGDWWTSSEMAVVRWNGTDWRGMGLTSGQVYCLHPVGASGMYVGGNFTVGDGASSTDYQLGRWENNAWQSVAPRAADFYYDDVIQIQVAANGDLYVRPGYRSFRQPSIYRWDGTRWSSVGRRLTPGSEVMLMGTAGLWLGGSFSERLMRWTGTQWNAVLAGAGLNNSANAIAVAPNGDLIVGGNFLTAGQHPQASYIARWTNGGWQPLGPGLNGPVYAVAVAPNGDVYAGGAFTNAGGNPNADFIARWNGSAWLPLGTGVDTTVTAVLVAGGTVYVGGNFTQAGGVPAARVARWNGSAWQPMGTATWINSWPINFVSTLVESPGGDIYMGGSFQDAGGDPNADYLARWNGTNWEAAVPTPLNGRVDAIAFNSATTFFVGGLFTDAGGNSLADGICRWSGTQWRSMGGPTTSVSHVKGMVVVGNELYAGGSFTRAGAVANTLNIGRWNGTIWTPLGTGLNGAVNGLAFANNQLYAVGEFTGVGDNSKAFERFAMYGANQPPSNLTLAPATVTENVAPGTLVGTFNTTDPNGAGTFTYALVPGAGAADNAAFTISGNTLRLAVSPDFETQSTYSIRMRTTDAGGQSLERTFTITVTDVGAPTLMAYSPGGGRPGTLITLTGTNFIGTTSVTFNGLPAQFAVVSATRLTALVPDTATSGPLRVITPEGTVQSVGSFSVTPIITAFTLASGPVGTVVTINGVNLGGATAVQFNGVAAASFAVLGSSRLTAVVPATGSTGKITVVTPSGAAISANTFKVVPDAFSFAPLGGAPGTLVTISGSGLTGVTSVRFGSALATSFSVLNATTVQAVVPPTATSGQLVVGTAGGSVTSVAAFTVAPTITSFSPASGAPGSVVVLTGRNFGAATQVRFNGVAAVVTPLSSTQVAAVVPAGATSGFLTATNAGGLGTSATSFTVTTGAVPTISVFSPARGLPGTVVTLQGTGFTGATGVSFGNVAAASFTVLSATSIVATVPAGAGLARIYVRHPNGWAQSVSSFAVITAPLIYDFAPLAGPVGTVVTLNGWQLDGATGVTFGGVPATNFTVVNNTQITVVVPAGAITGLIAVTTAAGAGQSTDIFTRTGPRPAMRTTPAAPTLVNLYPNPARVWVELETDAVTEASAYLVDPLGRVVRTYPVASGLTRLDLTGLPPGAYVVRVAGQARRLLVE